MLHVVNPRSIYGGYNGTGTSCSWGTSVLLPIHHTIILTNNGVEEQNIFLLPSLCVVCIIGFGSLTCKRLTDRIY
jgi:hypothetical protein